APQSAILRADAGTVSVPDDVRPADCDTTRGPHPVGGHSQFQHHAHGTPEPGNTVDTVRVHWHDTVHWASALASGAGRTLADTHTVLRLACSHDMECMCPVPGSRRHRRMVDGPA